MPRFLRSRSAGVSPASGSGQHGHAPGRGFCEPVVESSPGFSHPRLCKGRPRRRTRTMGPCGGGWGAESYPRGGLFRPEDAGQSQVQRVDLGPGPRSRPITLTATSPRTLSHKPLAETHSDQTIQGAGAPISASAVRPPRRRIRNRRSFLVLRAIPGCPPLLGPPVHDRFSLRRHHTTKGWPGPLRGPDPASRRRGQTSMRRRAGSGCGR